MSNHRKLSKSRLRELPLSSDSKPSSSTPAIAVELPAPFLRPPRFDINIDSRIRPIVMGDKPPSDPSGALGLTSVYPPSLPETIRREFLRGPHFRPQSLRLISARSALR